MGTPCLSCVLILGRAELASGLRLLLERFLLLGVGIPDLDLKVFAVGLDGVVAEGFDDLFASIAGLEAEREVRQASRSERNRTALLTERSLHHDHCHSCRAGS